MLHYYSTFSTMYYAVLSTCITLLLYLQYHVGVSLILFLLRATWVTCRPQATPICFSTILLIFTLPSVPWRPQQTPIYVCVCVCTHKEKEREREREREREKERDTRTHIHTCIYHEHGHQHDENDFVAPCSARVSPHASIVWHFPPTIYNTFVCKHSYYCADSW
jgi:hypothetical protein